MTNGVWISSQVTNCVPRMYHRNLRTIPLNGSVSSGHYVPSDAEAQLLNLSRTNCLLAPGWKKSLIGLRLENHPLSPHGECILKCSLVSIERSGIKANVKSLQAAHADNKFTSKTPRNHSNEHISKCATAVINF